METEVNINKSKIQFETYSQRMVGKGGADLEWTSINQRYNLKPIHNIQPDKIDLLRSEHQ